MSKILPGKIEILKKKKQKKLKPVNIWVSVRGAVVGRTRAVSSLLITQIWMMRV